MHKFIKPTAVFALAAMLTTLTASADDLDIYKTENSKPKMLFVLDLSGSMGARDGGPTRRVRRMTDALHSLIGGVTGIDVGLMTYGRGTAQLIHPVVDVEENQASLIAASTGLTVGGGTPTVGALLEAQRYLSGGAPYRGTEPSGLPNYQQPATSQCQSNHIVLLTDGRPSPDPTVVSTLQPLIGSCAARSGGRGTCGVELANYLATADQFSNIPDTNTITLHSIGFNIADSWLESLANAGGGEYKNATSSQELLTVFQSILNTVQLSSTAAAPTVSVNAFNQSRHNNELYYSFFQPGGFPRWEGNVKKYQLVNGQIVDANNQPLIQSGLLAETSQSLWSVAGPDGDSVQAGGMAAVQPAGRRWYTDGGVGGSLNGTMTPQQVTNNGQLGRNLFGATSDAERNELVGWVRGFDSIDRNSDGNTNEPNRYVADGIHSSPVLVTYQANAASNLRREVLYAMTNMGVLHAINPDNGNEIWSYTPAELLPNIKGYVDNSLDEHIYGLDGAITPHITYRASTSLDIDTDTVHLYLTQRRGGNNLFALDVSNALSGNPVRRLWKIEGGVGGTDFRDMGQSWSTPRIVPVKYGCPTNCQIKEALLFGGGYNPVYDDETIGFPVSPAGTGHGNAIYLVDPDNGALLWSAGRGTHHDVNIPITDSVPDSPVPIDSDGDGAVDIIFFADIGGNVWRVDLDKEATTAANLAIAGGKIAALNQPGQSLRFFNRPDVSISGVTNGVASFHISIGSGIRTSPTITESGTNRLFVIKDHSVFSHPTAFNPATGNQEPDYRYVTGGGGSRSVVTPGDLSASGDPTAYGFLRNLQSGEKILQPTLTTAGRIFLTSYLPPDPSAITDPCAYQTGTSRLRIIDLNTGSNKLPGSYGSEFVTIGSGITDSGTIIDTGDSGGPSFVIGTNSERLVDLLAPDTPNVFRRFFRTGWSELDD